MKKQILFVDDDPFILAGLKRLLRAYRNEWNVHFAHGGEEALLLMQQQPFDAIVTDMRMPGMNGATLLNEVCARYPEIVRIVLSGQSEPDLNLETVAADHILSKPCDGQTLKATIERALDTITRRPGCLLSGNPESRRPMR